MDFSMQSMESKNLKSMNWILKMAVVKWRSPSISPLNPWSLQIINYQIAPETCIKFNFAWSWIPSKINLINFPEPTDTSTRRVLYHWLLRTNRSNLLPVAPAHSYSGKTTWSSVSARAPRARPPNLSAKFAHTVQFALRKNPSIQLLHYGNLKNSAVRTSWTKLWVLIIAWFNHYNSERSGDRTEVSKSFTPATTGCS